MTDIYIGSVEEPLFHFKDDKIFSCSTVQTVALVGQELSIDTLTFSVQDDFESVHNITLLRSSDGETFETALGELYAVDVSVAKLSALVTLEYGTPVRYYKNGELVGKFYIDYVDRRGRNMYQVNAVSFIGLLDKINDIGGVFHASADTVGGILQKILAVNPDGTGDSIVDYEMDEDVSKVPAYCYLPYATKRQNLYQIMTAYGVNVIKGLNGNPHFTFIHTPVVEPQSIAVDNIYQDGNIEYERPYTQAIVTEHEYLEDANISSVTLFDNTKDEKSVTKQEIRFSSAPIVASTIQSDRQGLTIQAADDNRAIVSGVGVLTGKPYAHITNPVFGSKSTDETRAVQIQGCTAINVTNSQYALNRLKSFYMPDTENRMITRIRNSFVYSGQRCGKLYTLVDPFGESVTAYLAQMTITASGKDKVDAVFYVGYKPPDLSGLYNHSIIIKPPVITPEEQEQIEEDITSGIADNKLEITAAAELKKAEAMNEAAQRARDEALKNAKLLEPLLEECNKEIAVLQKEVDNAAVSLKIYEKELVDAEEKYQKALEYFTDHPDDPAALQNKNDAYNQYTRAQEHYDNIKKIYDDLADKLSEKEAYKAKIVAGIQFADVAVKVSERIVNILGLVEVYAEQIKGAVLGEDFVRARNLLRNLLSQMEKLQAEYSTFQKQATEARQKENAAKAYYDRIHQELIDAKAKEEEARRKWEDEQRKLEEAEGEDRSEQEKAAQKAREKWEKAKKEREQAEEEEKRARREWEEAQAKAQYADLMSRVFSMLSDLANSVIKSIIGNEKAEGISTIKESFTAKTEDVISSAQSYINPVLTTTTKGQINSAFDSAWSETAADIKDNSVLYYNQAEEKIIDLYGSLLQSALQFEKEAQEDPENQKKRETADHMISICAGEISQYISENLQSSLVEQYISQVESILPTKLEEAILSAITPDDIATAAGNCVEALREVISQAVSQYGGQDAVDQVILAARQAAVEAAKAAVNGTTGEVLQLTIYDVVESVLSVIKNELIDTATRVLAQEAFNSVVSDIRALNDDPTTIAQNAIRNAVDKCIDALNEQTKEELEPEIKTNVRDVLLQTLEDAVSEVAATKAVNSAISEASSILQDAAIEDIPDEDLDDTAQGTEEDAQNQGEQIQGDADGDAEDGVDDALDGAIDDEIGGELDDKADGAADEAEGESEEDAQHIQDDAEEEYSGDFDELSGLNDETDQAEEEARRKREEANRLREEADADPTNPEKQAAAEQAEDEADEAEEQARQKREERDGKREELADELAGFIADGLTDGIAENVLDKILDGLPDDIAAAVADALADILGDVIGKVAGDTIAEIIAGVIADIIATIAGEIAAGGANENAGNNADELGQKATELENLADELEEEAEQARAAADADPGNEELEEKAKDAEGKAKKARGDAEAARAAANAAGSLQNPDNLSDAEKEARAAALEAATEAAKKVLTEAALDIATEAAKEAAREAAIEAAKAYIQEKLDGILESLLEGAKNAANQAAIEAAKAAALKAMAQYPDDPEKVIKAATDAARKAAAQEAANYIANAIKALLDDDEFRDAVKQAAINAAIQAANEKGGEAISDALPDAIDAAGKAAAEGATGGANDGFKRGEITLPDEIFESEHPSIRVILIGGGYAGNDGGSGRTGSTTSAHTHFDGDLQTVWYGGQGGAGGQGGEGGSPGRVLSVTIDNPERTYTFRFGKGSDAPKPEEPEQEEEPETEQEEEPEAEPQSEPGENDGEQGEDQGDDEEEVSEQATIFGELTSEDEGSSIPESGVYDPFTEEYYAVKGKPGINGGAGGARKVDTGDGSFNWITSGEDVQDGDTTYYGGRPGNVLSKLTALPEAKFTAYGGNGAGAAVGIDRDKNSMLNGGSVNELIVEYDVEFESVGTVGGYAFGYGYDFVIKGEYIANEHVVYRPRHAYLQGRMLDRPMRISEEAVPALENVGGTLTINEVDSATQNNDMAQIMASVAGESRRSVYIGGAHAGSGTRYTPTTPEAQTINGGGGQGGHGGSGGAGSSTVVIENFKINGQDPTQYAFIMPPGQGGPGGKGGKGGSGCIIILYGGDTEENE